MRWYDCPLLWLQGEWVLKVLPSPVFGEVWITENPFCRCIRSSPFVIQTAMSKRKPWKPCASHYRTVAEVLRRVPGMKKFLMVGLGGGSFLHTVKHYWPDAVIEAIDIDPVMLAIAREYFDAPPEAILVLMDPRDYFRGDHGLFDFIFIDVFDGMYPPEELLNEEFFGNMAKALSPGGVVCMNTVRKHPWDVKHRKIRDLFEKTFGCVAEMPGLPGKVMPFLPHNVVLLTSSPRLKPGDSLEQLTLLSGRCSPRKAYR